MPTAFATMKFPRLPAALQKTTWRHDLFSRLDMGGDVHQEMLYPLELPFESSTQTVYFAFAFKNLGKHFAACKFYRKFLPPGVLPLARASRNLENSFVLKQ
jgi:hypothetical protein